MNKIIIMVILMIINLQINAESLKRNKSGNSNGFTMNAWYGGNNKHKCSNHKIKVRLKTRLLKY